MFRQRQSLFLFVLFACFFPPFLRAQVPTVTFGFQQNYNTYSWNFDVNYLKILGPRQKLLLKNRGLSNLLRPAAGLNKWRDQEQFGLSYTRPFFGRWNQDFAAHTNSYIDRQTGYENSAVTHWVSWGVNRLLGDKIRFRSALGHKWDSRQGHRDNGLYHRTDFLFRPTSWQGYLNRGNVSWQGDELGRRRDYDFRLNYRMTKEFYPGTVDSLLFQVNNLRRDYYLSTRSDLESRREKGRRVSNWLVYPLLRNLTLRQFSSFSNRRTIIHQSLVNSTGERDREELNTLNETTLEFHRHRVFSSLAFHYEYHTETYAFSKSVQSNPYSGLLGTPNSKSHLLTIKNILAVQLGARDSLSLLNSISRLQYDTPDTNNFDDRDELRSTHLAEWLHFFDPSFQFRVGVSARLHHLVYIYAAKSGENNWNRIFNFYTDLFLRRPDFFRFHQRAEVLANYTDYDFEIPTERIRSFVFRKMALTDSLRWQLFSQSDLLLFSRYELEENGRLSWASFSEQPLLSRKNHFLSLVFDFPISSVFRTSAGIQSYLRKEWSYTVRQNKLQRAEKAKKYWSYGPVFKLFLLHGPTPRGLISVSTLRVRSTRQRSYLIHQIQLQALWNF